MQSFRPSATSTLVNRPVTVVLEKFSHCTVASMQSQLPWDHKYGQGDLDIVFDNVRQMGHSDQIVTKRLLKVIYGTKIMEAVDLETLKAQAERDDHRATTQNLTDNDRYMSILAKCSKKRIAIRYQTYERKIRRTQVAFQTEERFEICLQEFVSFGLPWHDLDKNTRHATTGSIYHHDVPLDKVIFNSRPRMSAPPQENDAFKMPPPSQYHPSSQHAPGSQGQNTQLNSFYPSSQTRFDRQSQIGPSSPEDGDFQTPALHRQSIQPFSSSQDMSRYPFTSPAWIPPPHLQIPGSQDLTLAGRIRLPKTKQEPRPYSAPVTQAQSFLPQGRTIDELFPPARTLPFTTKPAEPPSSTAPAKSEAKPAPKRKRPAKKKASPRKRAIKSSTLAEAQSTIDASINKPVLRSASKVSTSEDTTQHKPPAGAPTRVTKPKESAAVTKSHARVRHTPHTPTSVPLTPALPQEENNKARVERGSSCTTIDESPQAPNSAQAPEAQTSVAQASNAQIPRAPALQAKNAEKATGGPLAESSGNARPSLPRSDLVSQGVQTSPGPRTSIIRSEQVSLGVQTSTGLQTSIPRPEQVSQGVQTSQRLLASIPRSGQVSQGVQTCQSLQPSITRPEVLFQGVQTCQGLQLIIPGPKIVSPGVQGSHGIRISIRQPKKVSQSVRSAPSVSTPQSSRSTQSLRTSTPRSAHFSDEKFFSRLEVMLDKLIAAKQSMPNPAPDLQPQSTTTQRPMTSSDASREFAAQPFMEQIRLYDELLTRSLQDRNHDEYPEWANRQWWQRTVSWIFDQ